MYIQNKKTQHYFFKKNCMQIKKMKMDLGRGRRWWRAPPPPPPDPPLPTAAGPAAPRRARPPPDPPLPAAPRRSRTGSRRWTRHPPRRGSRRPSRRRPLRPRRASRRASRRWLAGPAALPATGRMERERGKGSSALKALDPDADGEEKVKTVKWNGEGEAE